MEELLEAGVNVFRMNFSHGDFAEHQIKVDNAKIVSEKIGMTNTILVERI